MLSLPSDPRQYSLSLQQVQRQQQQPHVVSRTPYNVAADHHRDDPSLSFAPGVNVNPEFSSEGPDAASLGVQPDQIIFTDVAMKQEHIRRSSLADLFLDTPLCNAHTTGTDILWAGLPIVTLSLEKMATRVAGSLCLATGVGDEMIVHSMKEYEERAVPLAMNPLKLQDLTSRLKAGEEFGACLLQDVEFVLFRSTSSTLQSIRE